MGRIWLVPVLLVMWVSGAKTVHACSCTSPSAGCGPPADFWRASDVFTGRVVAVERITEPGQSASQRRVRLAVLERFRGSRQGVDTEVVLFTRPAALCGYPFKSGQAYLVYANRAEDGRMTTSVCSRTAALEDTGNDLAHARQIRAGNPPAGRLIGEVRRPSTRGLRGEALAGVAVAVTRQGITSTTVTDAGGRYGIELTTAGSYTVDVVLPETLYTRERGHTVQLPSAHACVELNIDVFFNGRLSGHITDSTGRAVAGLTVSHAPVTKTGERPLERRLTLTRDDGAFEIDRLQPGPFAIEIELPFDPSEETGMHQAEEGGRPLIVSKGVLDAAQRMSLGRIALPATVKIGRLEGSVHGVDGWPAAGARVFLRGQSNGHIIGAPAIADSLGRFVIAVLNGESYQVFAERPARERESPEFSDVVPVSISAFTPPLRLILRRRL